MGDELERWEKIDAAVDEWLDGGDSSGPADGAPLEDLLGSGTADSPLDRPLEHHLGELMDLAFEEPRRRGLGVGDEVGPYRIEGVIGEGGMGTVFLAHRADGSFDRAVALKVLYRSPADEGAHRRFLQERQILAGLRHPHIARLLDGGVVRGMPYLVMELIEGPPITTYARERRLGAEGKIRLLLQVCEAIRYAHRLGVIHRDLKPSNLLVEEGPQGEARLSVLDFGIALVEDAELAFTATGQVFGTPGYMAPEQALGRRSDVDRRSDVYALGVVLYELLSGERPFDGDDVPSILHKVLEGEATPLARHLPEVSRDLATITETCLRREPGLRYDSVRALAEDLESYLDGAPIRARPTGSLERWLRRARQRPRVAALVAGAAAVTLASLVLLLIVAVRYTRDLQAERNAAIAARQDAEELLDFMLQDLYAGLNRVGRLDLLEQVAGKSLDYFRSRPRGTSDREIEARALALSNAGQVLEAQGDIDRAMEAYEENRRFFEELLEVDPRPRWRLRLGRALEALANAAEGRGDLRRARELADRALALSEGLGREEPPPRGWADLHFRSLASKGWIARELASVEEALEALRQAEAFAAAQATREEAPEQWLHRRAVALSYIGLVHYQEGDLRAALESFRPARRQCEELVERQPSNTLFREELQLVLGRLGYALLDDGRFEEANRVLDEARLQAETLVRFDPGNADWRRELSVAHSALAAARREMGDLPQALEALEASLEISRSLARRSPDSATLVNDLAWDLLDLGRLQRALGRRGQAAAAWTEAVEALRAVRGESAASPYYLDTEVQALLELGRIEEARPLVRQLRAAGWKTPDFLVLAAEHGLEGEASPEAGAPPPEGAAAQAP